MNDTNPNVVLVTIPRKMGDPTMHTSMWGYKIAKLAQEMGKTVVVIPGNEVNYNDVSKLLYIHRPRLVVHVGHGCYSHIMGQKECAITSGNDGIQDDSNCNRACQYPSNLELLDGTIVYSIACYTSGKLGRDAVNRGGASAFIGQNEVLLFPVDSMGSQRMFQDVHVVFLKELLSGSTVREAAEIRSDYEDLLITSYKNTKYLSLPLLWNKLKTEYLGNLNSRI